MHSNTISDSRSVACTSFVYCGSNFSWNFRVLWGVLKKSRLEQSSGRDWVSELNSTLSFYYHSSVAEKCLEKCLLGKV